MQNERLNKLKEDVGTSVVATQMALYYLEKLSFYPSLYNKELKKYGNLYQKQLLKAELNQFDLADKEAEESTDIISTQYMDCIKYICEGNMVDLFNLVKINEARKKNPKAIDGIVNKILND